MSYHHMNTDVRESHATKCTIPSEDGNGLQHVENSMGGHRVSLEMARISRGISGRQDMSWLRLSGSDYDLEPGRRSTDRYGGDRVAEGEESGGLYKILRFKFNQIGAR